MKNKVLELLSTCDHCVVSTVGLTGNAQSAFVGYSEDNNLELVVGTYKDSRKYHNILANQAVSIVVADRDRKLEVQYEGRAKIMKPEELGERLLAHFKKIPASEKRLNDPNQVWIKISPSWIRFVDANHSPLKFEELSML